MSLLCIGGQLDGQFADDVGPRLVAAKPQAPLVSPPPSRMLPLRHGPGYRRLPKKVYLPIEYKPYEADAIVYTKRTAVDQRTRTYHDVYVLEGCSTTFWLDRLWQLLDRPQPHARAQNR